MSKGGGMDEQATDRFHSHLDECSQCRENPFGLCPIGNQLLVECMSVKDVDPQIIELVSENFWKLI